MTKLKKYLIITYLITLCFTSQLIKPSVHAEAKTDLGGTITFNGENGEKLNLPSLKTDLEVDVESDLARVTIVQTFINPTEIPLHATYLFPLNKDAAVHGMKMEIGDEVVEAKIKKKEKAKKIFKQAKKEGKAASLLVQHRPNMFTQDIANLVPGFPIKITLKYVQAIPKVDGDYQLVVPLIVGPRYQPPQPDSGPVVEDKHVPGEIKKVSQNITIEPLPLIGKWTIEAFPEYPMVFGPKVQSLVDRERVSIKVKMKASVPFASVLSNTHELDISGNEKDKVVTLSDGRTIDNRDFVLNYRLSGENTQAGLLTHRNEKGGYFSLLIEPPAIPQEKDITPREMVFVLDTSGSQEGEPLDASKTFMRHAMNNLRPDDYFRIINFGDYASELTNGPVRATRLNIFRGLRHIKSFETGGGTEIIPAIRKAFSSPRIKNTTRIVVFLTDGYVGNESEVLKLIHKKINNARIYAFGVGSGVNRYLLSEMGRIGRGFARYIDPTENSEQVAIKLAQKLESPVLTDISIDWKKLNVSEVTPEIIPDLFSGDSIRIQGKYEGDGLETIQVKGKVGGRKSSLPLQLNLSKSNQNGESDSAIPLVWARSKISDYMRQFNTTEAAQGKNSSDDELKFKITNLGLNHSLATKWTSFVAVSRRVVNAQPEVTPDTNVPIPMVKGLTPNAYPKDVAGSNATPKTYPKPLEGSNATPKVYPRSVSLLGASKITKVNGKVMQVNMMAGNSTPEPAAVMGMFTVCTAGLITLWFIRRKNRIGDAS